MRIRPARRLRGKIRLPGDKSISHRAAIISAMAHGTSRIDNFSTSQDCASTLDCIRSLGVIVIQEGSTVRISAGGISSWRPADVELDCGNSGSTMRMLAGAVAGCDFDSTLTGDESLRRRPMHRIIDPLQKMGARVLSTGNCAPLRITGNSPLSPVQYDMSVASAQVKSCILLAGLNADGQCIVWERSPTRDHTERMLSFFGVPLRTNTHSNGSNITYSTLIEGPANFKARDISVPGDMSSAAFFMIAATLLRGSDLEIAGVGVNSTRTGILRLLEGVGANIHTSNQTSICNEDVADLFVKGDLDFTKSGLFAEPIVIRGADVVQLIDELPVLAVLGSILPVGMTIRDASELRVKESDRISATVANLKAMGVTVDEFSDGMEIVGGATLRGAELYSFGDHRIAMAFTIAALLADGESELKGAECVAVSFPEFFSIIEQVAER